ncbi:hypothetical protein TNCV_295511 [Trichonephila clavipes]|nr:hypothetical protein TNCV_295511 [Trichonephila clavipes]
MIVITAEIESRFVAKDDLVPFHCSLGSSCAATLQTEASMGGRQGSTRIGRRDPKCPSAKRLVWFKKTQGPLMKMLSMPGWRPMEQLVLRMLFLRCGCFIDNWFIEDVLNLVFV